MKIRINWKHFLVLFIIIGGLYYLTKNILITSGILVVLLLIDGLLREYENKKRGEEQAKEIIENLRDNKTIKTKDKNKR